MKNYDLERKIYRYKTITKYQEKAKMLEIGRASCRERV